MILLLSTASGALAQTVSLSGALYQYRPDSDRPAPIPNYRVFLREPSAGKWIGPVLTDGNGRFALYNLKEGHYLLKIFKTRDTRSQVWQQEVTVPGRLPPIVLR
jgi:hypothetical protein